MNKIPTIFKRDMNNGGKIVDEIDVHAKDFPFNDSVATEKLDGVNIRITVRNHMIVRVEKRKNPTKLEKYKGIVDPWYVDAYEAEPGDKWMVGATKNLDLSNVPDGEWSGEAVGIHFQGNRLNLDKDTVYLFSCPAVTQYIFEDVPTTFNELKEWLPKQKSAYGNNCGIEGIVWHSKDGRMAKIKTKDFVKDNR